MFHINKFQNLNIVPFLLQQVSPQSVRQKRRKTLLQNTIFQQWAKLFTPDLAVYFMLVARH